MKFLSIFLLILNTLMLALLIAAIVLDISTELLDPINIVGTFWFFSITVVCLWCWLKQYRAPWMLLLGYLLATLSVFTIILYMHDFSELDITKKVVPLFCYIIFIGVGIAIVLKSKELHIKRELISKNT